MTWLLGVGLLLLVGLGLQNKLWTWLIVIPLGLLGVLIVVVLRVQSDFTAYWWLYWLYFATSLFAIGKLSLAEPSHDSKVLANNVKSLIPPATIPLIFLLLWQGLVVGFEVPKGIFPSVTDVWLALTASFQVLLNDSYITFVQEVLYGYLIGLIAGFVVALAVAYSSFLQRGFLPLAAAFGAVPIVGLAPVLGRAFGVDWESKAAVVVIITFFPVVLNVVQGLVSVDRLQLELLRAYAAKPRDIFFKLRLPNALPYLFNALKLAAVLAVISVIVAEFLIPGPPRGLGQRISLSARQGAYDTVFAAIIVSSFISIAFYNLISWLERRLTSWHISFREEP